MQIKSAEECRRRNTEKKTFEKTGKIPLTQKRKTELEDRAALYSC